MHISCFLAQSLGTIICPSYADVTRCQEHANCVMLNYTHQCVCDTGFFPERNQCLGEYIAGLSEEETVNIYT